MSVIKGQKTNNDRKYPGIKRGHTYHKRAAVSARNAARREDRGPREQLCELDRRLGNGVGAKRERARLHAQISKGRAS